MKEALFISWVGMGLVFVGLIALWIMMVILVKVTNSEKKTTQSAILPEINNNDVNDRQNLLKAAAAAVAVAKGLLNSSFSGTNQNEKGSLTPWETTHRTRQISQDQSVFSRKD